MPERLLQAKLLKKYNSQIFLIKGFRTSSYSTNFKILVNLKRVSFTIMSCDFYFSRNHRNITKLLIGMNTFSHAVNSLVVQ